MIGNYQKQQKQNYKNHTLNYFTDTKEDYCQSVFTAKIIYHELLLQVLATHFINWSLFAPLDTPDTTISPISKINPITAFQETWEQYVVCYRMMLWHSFPLFIL